MQSIDPKRAVTQITQRLSLRKPQAESLRRLDDIVDLIAPSKETDVEAARDAVRQVFEDGVVAGGGQHHGAAVHLRHEPSLRFLRIGVEVPRDPVDLDRLRRRDLVHPQAHPGGVDVLGLLQAREHRVRDHPADVPRGDAVQLLQAGVVGVPGLRHLGRQGRQVAVVVGDRGGLGGDVDAVLAGPLRRLRVEDQHHGHQGQERDDGEHHPDPRLPGPLRLRWHNKRFEPVDGFDALFL